jgi:hypothetical protein
MLREFTEMRERDPAFAPARPMAPNPYTRPPRELLRAPEWPPRAAGESATGGERITPIDDPDAVRVSDLFDASYAVLLRMLERFFSHGEETDAELRVVANASVDLMREVIRPLGELLARLPAGPAAPGLNAGPSFLVSGWTPVTAHKPAAWRVLRERLVELADVADALGALPVAGPMRRLASRLEADTS